MAYVHEASELILAITFILPCYVSSMSPIILSRFITGRTPLDLGRNFIDGRRILGDGKSIEGFVFGSATGYIAGIMISGDPVLSFILSVGAMCGDSLGSFIKRRLGLRRGSPLPLVDQLDFVLVPIAICYAFHPIGAPGLMGIIYIVLVTPPLHVISNAIAYLMKLKEVPW